MSKKNKQKLKLMILLGILLGLIRSMIFLKEDVFARTPSEGLQNLLNTVEKNDPISSLFEGGGLKENFYEKALKANEKKEADKIIKGLDKLETIIKKSDKYKNNFTQNDILNILYKTNKVIKEIIDSSCNSKNCRITQKNIDESYRNIIKGNNNVITQNELNQTITKLFSIYFTEQSALENIEESVIGDDIFMNGVDSDGPYDIQIDIQNIGNLLFESFIPPMETVFYNMPPNYDPDYVSENNQIQSNNQNDSDNDQNNKSDILNLISQLLNDSTKTDNTNDTDDNNADKNGQKNNPPEIVDTSIQEPEIQELIDENNFIEKNNNPKSIQGNICISDIPATENIEEAIEGPTSEEIIDYLKITQQEIDIRADINSDNNDAPPPSNGDNNSGDGNDPIITQEAIDSITNNTETQSCFDGCKIYKDTTAGINQQRILCQMQCLCFAVSRPNYIKPELTNMNKQLKLRFCMVPAPSTAIPSGTSIFSLDSILTRIHNLMYKLVNGGEMMKYQKTKEYLDNPIAELKRDKLFSFNININTKPMFSNKSKIAKEDQKKTDKEEIANNVGGTNKTIGQNPNKYLVIADPIKAKLYKENITKPSEFQEKYNQELVKIAKANEKIEIDPIKSNKNKSLNNIANFLSENLKFLEQIENKLINININVQGLQSKL